MEPETRDQAAEQGVPIESDDILEQATGGKGVDRNLETPY